VREREKKKNETTTSSIDAEEKKTRILPHQRQVLRGRLFDGRAEVGVEVDDVLEVEAELRRVLVEGITVCCFD